MSSALSLLLYVVVASVVGPVLLRRATWPSASPRAGLLAWQGLSLSVLVAAGLAGLALADLCAAALPAPSVGPVNWVASTVGSTVVIAGAGRLIYSIGQLALERRRATTRLRSVLDLLAEPERHRGALVLQHASPYAFCLAGLAPRVVVTSALLQTLTPPQIAAVLAHESAHLRQRHHLVTFVAKATSRAFGRVLPWLYQAETETAFLVELMADDSAARSVGWKPLRDALSVLREAPIGGVALAASGSCVQQRVARLEGASSCTAQQRQANLVAVALLLLGLLAVALLSVPTIPAAWHDVCLLH